MSEPIYTEELTIEDILSHRTGFPNHDEALLGERAASPDTPKTVTRNLRNLPINKSMRTTYQYSNIMYTVASYLVEVLTGMAFGSFLESRLWQPLGMMNTFLQVHSVEQHGLQERLSKGYRWDRKKEEFVEVPWWRQPEGQGAGSMFSCVSDFAKWIQCMMHQTFPLSEGAHKELTKPRIIADPDRGTLSDEETLFSHSLYALGWEIKTYRGHTLIGHDGAVNGFECKMVYLPRQDWGIVIFCNVTGGAEAAEVICYTLIDELLSVSLDDTVDWSQVMQKRREMGEHNDENQDLWEVDPKQRLSLPLSLVDFTGQYYHPGYRTITFVIEADQLVADCSDRSNPFKLCLRHVSDTRFTVEYSCVWDDYTVMLKAQFRLREDGMIVTGVGINIPENMPDDLIWFDKV